MDELPEHVLLCVFRRLDATSLTRLERVSQKCNLIAKLAWTTKATDGLDLSNYFNRSHFSSMMAKCGPYIEIFRFTPSGRCLKLDFEFWSGAVERFRMSRVKVVHIDNTMEDLQHDDPRISAFLGQFHTAEQLILPTHFTCRSLGFPRSLAFTECMPNLYALYFYGTFNPEDTPKEVWTILAAKLRMLHLGAVVPVGGAAPLQHLCLLTKLQHLSLELKFFRKISPTECDASFLQLAKSCPQLESLLVYYPMRLSRASCLAVVAHLPKLKIFWNQGRFLVPQINTEDDLLRANNTLAGCWSRKISVFRRFPRFPPELNVFHFSFGGVETSSYADSVRKFLENSEPY